MGSIELAIDEIKRCHNEGVSFMEALDEQEQFANRKKASIKRGVVV